MFKKFAMLLTPFALASFGTLLTSSTVQAAVWTAESKCYFPRLFGEDYTLWRALIETRATDRAARVIRFQYGVASSNSERITSAKLEQRRIINGVDTFVPPSITFYPYQQTAWTSPIVSHLQFVSAVYRPRYVRVTLTNADGRTCKSNISF